MTKRMLELSVVITRNYGAHAIEFGMKEICEIASGSHRRSAYNNLVMQLNDQIDLYETVSMNQIRLPQTPEPHSESPSRHESIPLTAIVVSNRHGKREVSAKGGKYSKHGVAIYVDTCKTDLPIEDYEYGDHDVSGYNLEMTVDIIDGKAKRVLSIK